MVKKIKKESGSNENIKLCALLSYLLVGIIWFFADEKIRKSDYVKYHVKQGIVLFIAWLIVSVIWQIPVFGKVVAPILDIILIVLLVIGIINALNMQKKQLPIVGGFAEKFNF